MSTANKTRKRIKTADGIWLKAGETYFTVYKGTIREWTVRDLGSVGAMFNVPASLAFYTKEACIDDYVSRLEKKILNLAALRDAMILERAKGTP